MEMNDTNESSPPPPSAALLASAARFNFYVGGVGAGKTTAGALRALAWALDHPAALA
jgi:hypothetical protein